jgi:hypothetical protein
MLRTAALSLVVLLSATPGVAQPGSPTLQVTDQAGVRALQSLNARVDALSKQVMVCVEKKLAPPESCMCKYPSELAAVQKEYQSVLRANPSWATRAVSWTDNSSGTLVGHTIAIPHLAPQLNKCAGK